jgi:ABC-type amino acid transport substrate-binding protein
MGNKSSLLTLFLIVFSAQTMAQNESLKFFVWSNDLAPIVSVDESTGEPSGIVIDVLISLPAEHQVDIKIVLTNRVRGEAELYAGTVDAAPLAKRWLKQPEKLIYSLPLFQLKEFLYSKTALLNQPLLELLRGKSICTRRGYSYPVVNDFFLHGLSFRVDSHIEQTQFEMLLKDRCDYVITNEHVGDWIIDKNAWQNDIHKAVVPLEAVDFSFAFHPSKQAFVTILNQHIRQLQESGELQNIVAKHRNRM